MVEIVVLTIIVIIFGIYHFNKRYIVKKKKARFYIVYREVSMTYAEAIYSVRANDHESALQLFAQSRNIEKYSILSPTRIRVGEDIYQSVCYGEN